MAIHAPDIARVRRGQTPIFGASANETNATVISSAELNRPAFCSSRPNPMIVAPTSKGRVIWLSWPEVPDEAAIPMNNR